MNAATHTGNVPDLTRVLDVLSIGDDELLCQGHRPAPRKFRRTRVRAGDLRNGSAAVPKDRDFWLGYFPVTPMGSMDALNTLRVPALFADLDDKADGGMGSRDGCEEVTAALSEMLGQQPVAIIESGHGLQPLWAIEDATTATLGRAKGVLKRFGGLVQMVARAHGGAVDNVFEAARVLRMPGSVNHKDPEHPVAVRVRFLGGAPLALDEIEAVLDTYEMPDNGGEKYQGDTRNRSEATEGQRAEALGRLAARAREVAEVRQERNNRLNRAAFIAGHYVPHYLVEDEVVHALMAAAETCGLVRDDGEPQCRATIKSGLKKGMTTPQQLPDGPTLHDVDDLPSIENEVFGYSDTLEIIRQAARARLVSPWAVLGGILALVVAEIPPHFVIPPMVGSVGSLNLAVALTGPSGTSKSTSMKVARELLGLSTLRARRIGPGSGEGLLNAYLERDTSAPRRTPRGLVMRPQGQRQCILYADEVGQMGALKERSGSTHSSLLRSALTGDDLYTTNADPDRNRHVPAGEYRLTMVVGVQPSLASILLDDTEEGGPQRFLWLPSQDPQVPDQTPDWPATSILWSLPVDPLIRNHTDLLGHTLLGFPERVRSEAQDALRARHRAGLATTDPDSHTLLTRCKVAAGAAMLHGRLDVSDDDWEWSGVLMRLSLNVRRKCEEVSSGQRVRELQGRVAARRKANAGAASVEADDDARSVFHVVAKHARGEAPERHKGSGYNGCPKTCLTRSVPRLRGVPERLATAIEYGMGSEWLVVDEEGRVRPSGKSEPNDARR